MKILLTGRACYIGSHVLLCCPSAGHSMTVLDDFSNNSPEALARVPALTGQELTLYRGDIYDVALLRSIVTENHIETVMHFAGLKSVAQSVVVPLDYCGVNVAGSMSLALTMKDVGVLRLALSSTASVYSEQGTNPLTEESSLWKVANIVPYAMRVAVGRIPVLYVFGNDYPTRDGTGVRDYIHVVDHAERHLAALNYLARQQGYRIWNLGTGIGTGRGHSVFEVIRGLEHVTGQTVPWRFALRRLGDAAQSCADHTRASSDSKWQPTRGLQDMLADFWRWQKRNPKGYRQ